MSAAVKRKHTHPVNRVSLTAFACDAMRDYEDFDPQKGWQQVVNKDVVTQQRYSEFVMLLRIADHFDLDLKK